MSAIAVALEGVIEVGGPVIPVRKRQISIQEFYAMNNGNKPAVLKRFPSAHIFVPFIDSRLRNGLGHNSAAYDVKVDAVLYSNRNAKGTSNHQLSYTRFCEKIILLYRQLELVYMYLLWLRGRTLALPNGA
jgi:hypothetical protein